MAMLDRKNQENGYKSLNTTNLSMPTLSTANNTYNKIDDSSKTIRRVHFHHTDREEGGGKRGNNKNETEMNVEVEKHIIEYEIDWKDSDFHAIWHSSEELMEIQRHQVESFVSFATAEMSDAAEYRFLLSQLWASCSPSSTAKPAKKEILSILARFHEGRGWEWNILQTMKEPELSMRPLSSPFIQYQQKGEQLDDATKIQNRIAITQRLKRRSTVQDFVNAQQRYRRANVRLLSAKYARDSRQSVAFARALAEIDVITHL